MTKNEWKTRELVESWLDKQIKIHLKRIENASFTVNDDFELNICGTSDYIQLYNCIDKIANILNYVKVSKSDRADGNEEYYFVYKGVKFIEVKIYNE